MLIDKFHVFLYLFSSHFFPVQTLLQFGSLLQITRPCPIKYKSMKVQHQQVQQDRRQTLTEFIKEDESFFNVI
jgi:nitrate reductase gamma subunit